MAKNITIVVLVFMLCVAILYGFFQTTAAQKVRIQAAENERVAIEQRVLAEKNAAVARSEAERANMEAERCKECCLKSRRSN